MKSFIKLWGERPKNAVEADRVRIVFVKEPASRAILDSEPPTDVSVYKHSNEMFKQSLKRDVEKGLYNNHMQHSNIQTGLVKGRRAKKMTRGQKRTQKSLLGVFEQTHNSLSLLYLMREL